MSSFVRNAWYMAAWSDEVGDPWLARTLLNEPVLIYRTTDGVAAAIADQCPHRFAPLSRGTLIGDTVQCGYHGLRFDGTGACVHNPSGNGRVPSRARVRAYPLVEQHGILWIWMGDPARANEFSPPDYSRLSDPLYSWRLAGRDNRLGVKANYLLVADNLLDLTHTAFLHETTLAPVVPAVDEGSLEVVPMGTGLEARLWIPSIPAASGDGLVDQWLDMRWEPPGAFWLDVGQVLAGQPPRKGENGYALHVITPETELSTHYFFGSARLGSHHPDAKHHMEAAFALARRAFETEDGPMLEACQDRMGAADLWSLDPVMLAGDGAAALARRMMQQLITEEARASPAGSGSAVGPRTRAT